MIYRAKTAATARCIFQSLNIIVRVEVTLKLKMLKQIVDSKEKIKRIQNANTKTKHDQFQISECHLMSRINAIKNKLKMIGNVK